MVEGARRQRVLGIAGLVALAALVLASLLAEDGDAPPLEAGTPTDPASEPAVPPSESAAAATRTATAPEVPIEIVEELADLSLPHEFRLRLRVQDWNGLPLPGAHVLVAPARCGFSRWPEATDDSGRVEVVVRGRTESLELWYAIAAWGTLEPMRVVTLHADRSEDRVAIARGTEHDAKALQDRIRRLGEEEAVAELASQFRQRQWESTRRSGGKVRRRDQYDTICGRSLLLFHRLECGTCHPGPAAHAWTPFAGAPVAARRLHPHAVFSDLGAAQATPGTKPDTVGPARLPDREDAIQKEFGRSRVGVVNGVVRDAQDRAVPGAVVAWLGVEKQLRNRARADEEGRYRLLLPATGPCTLVALAAGLGHDEAVVAVAPSTEQTQDFRLRASSSVRGRALGEDGAPLLDARVEFVSDSEPGAAWSLVAKDGSFAVADVPRSGRLLLWPGESGLVLPVRVSDSVLTDRATIDLALRAAEPVRARVRIDPNTADAALGRDSIPFEVRVLQVDTGCAAHALPAGGGDGFRLEGLAVGPYRVDVGAPGRGWVALGPVHLDGLGLWDLGAAPLPAPGRIRFAGANSSDGPVQAAEFWLQREDTDVLVRPDWREGRVVELPPGTYAIVWIGSNGALLSRRVPVESGREVVVSTRE